MINFHPSSSAELKPRITVIGVGGAGGNAVNNMIQSNLEGVEFIVANTDAQAIAQSRTDRRIQLGAMMTQGLGAGARPDVGRAAAEETIEEIIEQIKGSNMVFITAGMGGGTGTGAAPVIARAAREHGILTIGVVTKPFQFEGAHRMRLAEAGIEELSQFVDTLIIVPNQNLFRVASERTTFADAFKMADDVLQSGVRGVTDLMINPGLINLDFADIRTVMSEMGKAMMGTGEAEGEKRAQQAAEAAINNPLLEDISMKGARAVLINITGGMDISLFEVDEAANRIREEVDPEANIIVGSTLDPTMEGRMRVSVVATGIDAIAHPVARPTVLSMNEPRRPAMVPTPVQPASAHAPVVRQTLAERVAAVSQAYQVAASVAPVEAAMPAESMSSVPMSVPSASADVPATPSVATPPQPATVSESALPTLHFDVDPVAPASPAPTVANHGPRAQPSVRVEPTIGLRPPPQAPRRDPAQGTLSIDRPPAARQEAQIDVRNMTVSQAVAALAEADKPVAAAEPGRRSFIDRLTGNARQVTPPAGPARRIEPSPPAYAPSLEASAPAAARISAGDRGGNTRQEEDMLDIPAFLRRQAN